jgi:hypothetical protein
MKVMRDEGRIIVTLDKTWVIQNNALPKCWQDSEGNGGLKCILAKKGV